MSLKSFFEISDILKHNLPKDYVYIHIKKATIDKLGWGINDLSHLFNELLKYYEFVIFTNSIGLSCNSLKSIR